MKLIVGLGNPGLKYKNTRHNVGFMFVDSVTKDLGIEFKVDKNFKALTCITKINDEQIHFIKPITYMNESGLAVIPYANYYKIAIEDILVIHDDLDLPVGKIRIRKNGSCGGHNGMRSIINLANSNDIKRIRIGIDKSEDVIDYVLGDFKKDERKKIDEVLIIAPNIIHDYLCGTFENLMNKYNKNE